jgi:hypothetical protein
MGEQCNCNVNLVEMCLLKKTSVLLLLETDL